ncbi:hypothetical protein CEXT_468011 [Caerostris extrusa]|uniref:Uncharacterized protein n=1 Tax=Caerostris extrusa TaxID=172846 RepID=A0AAV4XN86_CAEEX|nr:hypothetical protein CEXT_468011 [Caerostris extrusa]
METQKPPSMTHLHKTQIHLTVMADKSLQYRLSPPETTDPLISLLCHEDPPSKDRMMADCDWLEPNGSRVDYWIFRFIWVFSIFGAV